MISFKITIKKQSVDYYPTRIAISFPLNPNKIYLDFSPVAHSIIFTVHSNNLVSQQQLVGYTTGVPIDFSIKISTVQSDAEFISITVKNGTHSITKNLDSDIQGLLNDQARLVSVEVSGTNKLVGESVNLTDNAFWTIQNIGEGQGRFNLIQSGNTFSIIDGNFSQNYIEHFFGVYQDWGSFGTASLALIGQGTGDFLRFWINSDWDNRAFYYIRDDFVGSKQLFFSLNNPDEIYGRPNFSEIERIGLDFPKTNGTWGLTDLAIGSVDETEPSTNVNISDLSINILPHSLAYAPLTTTFALPSALTIALLLCVLTLFFPFISSYIKRLYSRLNFPNVRKLSLFAATFAIIFCLYFLLFGLGDHAFDMYSQKLWSYDMAKYGILSLYQRPAVTSAALMYDGAGTQHAIFPYAPLAGLYYFIIGKTYLLFSSNPSVYDPLLTTTVKLFQTLTAFACGLLVFKIMRCYKLSWKKSFLVMLIFLLNPLIIYDTAIWGHQDVLLIFFLLLSLWAYESNHPTVSISGLVLAIMVKSTAFAPAALMTILLIKKFGIRRLINGILGGLSTGIAVILPFLFSGASPSMMVNSTVFRALQFGTLAYQYPRSAAVSPDGFNIWPLFTYLLGARSRDRMWYPDYVQEPIFGISILLVGEILFISLFLVSAILAMKKNSEAPGRAALLLGLLMVASTILLTKTTARYLVFGVAYLIVALAMKSQRAKWIGIGFLTFTSVFAMHGLLVYYTGFWLDIYPAMSPNIPFNGAVLSLYLSDAVISGMVLINILAFTMILLVVIREFRSKTGFVREKCECRSEKHRRPLFGDSEY